MQQCDERNKIKENDGEVENFVQEEWDDITVPFNPKDIDIQVIQNTLFNILDDIESKIIRLDPDFQRNFVWDDTRKSRLIESILLGIPLQMFYMSKNKDGKYEVVDGLQRLQTLSDFKSGLFKLKNLEFLGKEIDKKTFEELPNNYKRDILKTNIQITIIRPATPEEVKFTIFKRINTGGIYLTDQEIRHALHQGKATIFLKNLAQNEDFIKLNIKDKNMLDREFVLRFLSFYLFGYENFNGLDNFLSNGMIALNEIGGTPEKLTSGSYLQPKESVTLDELTQKFKTGLNRAYNIFDLKYVFRRTLPNTDYEVRTPINKTLFTTWTYWLSKISPEEYEKILLNREKLFESCKNFYCSQEFTNMNRLNDKKIVYDLFEKIKNIIMEYQ